MKNLTDTELSHKILGCAYKIHTALGPGLLESVYRKCLAYELRKLGLRAEEEKPIGIIYEELTLDKAFRIDILVENRYILELKVVDELLPVHAAQILTYLKFANIKYGLLLNFKEESLHPKGVKRYLNKHAKHRDAP